MKPLSRRRVAGTVAMLVMAMVRIASGQLPVGVTVAFSKENGGSTDQLAVTDPGNHTWAVQSSPDLKTWTTAETVKVHNGRLQRTFSPYTPIAGLFYRLHYDS